MYIKGSFSAATLKLVETSISVKVDIFDMIGVNITINCRDEKSNPGCSHSREPLGVSHMIVLNV